MFVLAKDRQAFYIPNTNIDSKDDFVKKLHGLTSIDEVERPSQGYVSTCYGHS